MSTGSNNGQGVAAVAVVRASLGVVVVCAAVALSLGSGVASSSGVSGSGPALGLRPAPRVELHSVSCWSRRGCMALGLLWPRYVNLDQTGPYRPISYLRTGRSWSAERMPTRSVGSLQVSCPSSSACFAAGNDNEANRGLPLLERWNGRRWSIQPTPPSARGADGYSVLFSDISCTSANACTVVGIKGYMPLVERWNGRTWSQQQTAPHTRGWFTNVSCTSATACVAVGFAGAGFSALAERWNGSSWSRVRIPSKGYFAGLYAAGGFDDLSCMSATACVAVGGWTADCPSSDLRVAHHRGPAKCTSGRLMWLWNGSHWTFSAAPGGVAFQWLSCVSARWCVASSGELNAGVQHWNGVRWAPQLSPSLGTPNDGSCTATTSCVVVGAGELVCRPTQICQDIEGAPQPLVWIWNGNHWTDRSPPDPNRTNPTIR